MNSSYPIRAVVFDCFGVLYEDAFKQFVERYAPAERAYYYDLALQSDRGLLPRAEFYAALAKLSGQAPAAVQRHIHRLTVLNDDLVGLIGELKPRYRIGMLSNAERGFLDRFLENHGLVDQFDATLASSETPYVKPQREIFELMAGRLDVTLPEMVFIDDSVENTRAAAGYGIRAVPYRNPAGLRHELTDLLN